VPVVPAFTVETDGRLPDGTPVADAIDRVDAALQARLPSVRLLGGCCGTDHRHVAEIVAAWPDR
jgi:S-methylmethionine-dependent homocysteine/selenocysteine methylase